MYQKISLGTAQFGLDYGVANKSGIVSDCELAAILELANKYEVNTLDTAVAYGKAEERLGKYELNHFQIISKLPEIVARGDSIESAVEILVSDSLRRLNISSLYGLLLHRPQELLKHNGFLLYESLSALKTKKMIGKIGISVYSPEELDEIDKTGMVFDIVQIPFNILDNRFLLSGWLDRLADNGVEVHARSVFLQGLLLMPLSSIPDKFDRWSSLWNKWHKWLDQNQLDALSVCLNYVLSFPQIQNVIVGVDSSVQFEQILKCIFSTTQFNIPQELKIIDQDLLNPARWSLL